jgi:hypothetical protein
MKFIDFLKDRMRDPTPLERIARELGEAYVEKLEAETALDWASSVVNYNKTRIARLNERLNEHKENQK